MNPEKKKVLMFSFAYGLFFGVFPLIIFNLMQERTKYNMMLSPMTLRTSIYIGLISAVIYLITGNLWYKRKSSLGKVSYTYSMLLWSIASVIVVVAMLMLPFLFGFITTITKLRIYTELTVGLGWAFIIGVRYIPLSLIYGCLLGVIANYLLKNKFREILTYLFISGFIILVIIGHQKTKYTWGRINVKAMQKLAKKNKIDELLKYLDHTYALERRNAMDSIINMDTNISLPVLADLMLME